MTDVEKVIDDLRLVEKSIFALKDGQFLLRSVMCETIRKTRELLKKQLPTKPRKEKCGKKFDLDVWCYVCDDCGRDISPGDCFCRHCGKQVIWDDGQGEDY